MEKKLLYIVPETTVVAVKTALMLTASQLGGVIDINNSSDPDDEIDPDNGDEILSKNHDVWEGWE